MKAVAGSFSIAPVYSAAFMPKPYRPKKKMPNSSNKSDINKSAFSLILSELLNANESNLPQKLKARD